MKKITILGIIVVLLLVLLQTAVLAATVTSPFGWRNHPITGKWHFHTGIDIQLNTGTPLVALFDGEVVYAGAYKGYGNTVLLQHSGNRYTLYGHCDQILVNYRQKVRSGEVIARSGNTGLSTGPHLHLEYWVNHQYVDPMVIWQGSKR